MTSSPTLTTSDDGDRLALSLGVPRYGFSVS